jgi:streptogramin lyase
MTLRLTFLAALVAVAGCNTPAEPMDSGSTPMNDTGVVPVDMGVVPDDTGVIPNDAGVDAAATPNDAGTDAGTPGADANVDGGTTTGCGTAQPTLPTPAGGTEGLVIARDGTIYYSVNGGVARIGTDGTNTAAWLTIPGATTIWGLALDATNTHLYICDVGAHRVRVATNLTTTPTQMMLATVAQPNGITVGPDGAVYVSDFSGNSVIRIDATTGTTTTVTASSIAGADGVAFTDDGHLLVTSYSAGTVLSLALDAAHHETGRTTAATGVGSADGVALDSTGTIWVGGGSRVYRIGAGGTPDMMMTTPGGTANLEWGSGVLGCHDLYVATGSGLRRITTTVVQRAVPWH